MVIGDSKLKFLFYPVRNNAPLEFLRGFTITITDHHH